MSLWFRPIPEPRPEDHAEHAERLEAREQATSTDGWYPEWPGPSGDPCLDAIVAIFKDAA